MKKDMKHIVSRLLMFLMAWLSVGAYAQTNRISITGATMSRGGESTLSVYMDNVEEVNALEFTLEMPTGITINPISAILTDRAKNHQITARKLKNGKYRFVVLSSSNAPFDGMAGTLFTMQVNAAESLTDETDYPIILSDAVMSVKSGDNVLQETEAGKITIKSLPNLHVVSVDCSDPVAGSEMTVKWKVRNDGRGATDNIQWKDYIWLVPAIKNGTTANGSKLLATIDNLSALLPGESYENTANVKLDERIYGKYDIVVSADMPTLSTINWDPVGGEVPYPYNPEAGIYNFLYAMSSVPGSLLEEKGTDKDKDNFFYKLIDIAIPPLPDLQVTSVVASVIPLGYASGQVITEEYLEAMVPTPLTAAGIAHNTVFYSGKKVQVTATIANRGGVAVTKKSWKNALYVSTSADRNSSSLTGLSMESSEDITIQPGESTTVSFVTKLPYEQYGDIYFHVYADTDDQIYELANTQNNWGCSSAINVLLTPGANFLPQNLRVPSIVTSGSSFTVSYDVKNIGAGVPYNTLWKDKVFLSKTNTLNNEAIDVGTFSQYGSWVGPTFLADQIPAGAFVTVPAEDFHFVGDSYSASRNLTLSNLSSGAYYVLVKVDAEDHVFEFNGESNNVISYGPIQVVNSDLTVELLSVSENVLSTDKTVAFSWKLKNTGSGDIKNVKVKDAVYAGSNANGSNLILIGEVSNSISITSGGEKILMAKMKIPDNTSLTGTKYIFVKTNIDNEVDESNNSNNLSSGIVREFKYVSPGTSDPALDKHVKGMNITVSGLTVPSSVTPGQQIQISYLVKNTGELTVDKDVTHEVYVSDSKSFDASSAIICLANSTPISVMQLEPDKSISATMNITIPSTVRGGTKYLYVVLNRNNQLSEKIKSDNEVSTPMFVNGNLPDFRISDVSAPGNIMTAEPTSVSWTLKNDGSWEAAPTTCYVYLSKDNVYDKNDTQLASVKSKALTKGGNETMKADVILDDDVIGNYHLIFIVNRDNDIEESDTNNNTQTAAFVSKQSPLPDLTISDLSVEGTIRPGAEIRLNAKVQNVGDSYTRKDKWTDVFYFSTDFSLNTDKAICVGNKTHVGKLEKDGTYTLSVTLNIPANVHGYYFLYAKTDGSDAIIEKSRDNNIARIMVNVEDGSDKPANLSVKSVSAPSNVTAGTPITISYTLENSGQFSATGNLREIIYLSKDQHWDENDKMIGVVSSTIDLAPGNVEVRKATGRITNVVEGNYYLIVRTNSTHSVAETDYDDNTTIAKSYISVRFANLSVGASSTVNTSGYYKLPISSTFADKTIGLNLSHGSTIPAGLYVAYESIPSTARYDRSSNVIQTTEQEILIPNVREGNYYILAQDNSVTSLNLNEFVLDDNGGAAGANMNLSVREVHFGASSLSIKEGGNNGWITTEMHGALLDSIMDFRLSRDDQVIPIESMTFYDQTSTRARFNLNDAQTGTYDIVSELPDGSLSTMSDGFRVVPGVNVGLGVKLDAPRVVRVGNYAPLTVAYANGGNTDIVIRELLLVIDKGYLATTIEGLKEKQSELHIRIDEEADKRGFITIPPGKQEIITLYMEQHAATSHLNLYIVK